MPMMVIIIIAFEELVVILNMTSMNTHYPRFRETQRTNIDKGTIYVPRKPAIQTRNVALRPASSQETSKQQNLDFVSVLMNLTAFAKTRPPNIPSTTQQQTSTSRTNKKHPGFKYNRMKTLIGTNRFPRNTAGYSESLY